MCVCVCERARLQNINGLFVLHFVQACAYLHKYLIDVINISTFLFSPKYVY